MILPHVRPNEKGMTLIEVLVSFAIMSMLVMSFYSIFSQAVKQTSDEQYADQALTVARAVMDGLKQQIFQSNQLILFDQTLDISAWKCDTLGKLPSGESCTPELTPILLSFPTLETPQFRITVTATRLDGNIRLELPSPKPLSAMPASPRADTIESKGDVQLVLDDYFRKISVDVRDPAGRTHHYEHLVTVR